jgi:putative ABC transport system permease protein
MKKLILQAVRLIKQNPFYSLVAIVGTAVTIAFVMVVIMIYEFRSADMAPETDRSRLIYTDTGVTMQKDGTNRRQGMNRWPYEAIFTNLPGVEDDTWYAALIKGTCSLPASFDRHNYYVKSVAPNWFSFFEYDFIAGRPFTQAEYDLTRSAFQKADSQYKTEAAVMNPDYRCVVVAERVARQFFGSAEEAVGKTLLVNFLPATVVGVVADVSSIFQAAYAEIFQPFTLAYGKLGFRTENHLGIIKLAPNTSVEEVRREVERRELIYNEQQTESQFKMQNLYTHTEYTFFRGSSVNPHLVYILLILVLLGVPAISISGLMNAQMQGRLSEIAIRKAYGASNVSIIGHFFVEGLVNTLIGGALGFVLSYALVSLGRVWLLGNGINNLSAISVDISMALRLDLFVLVLLVCLIFNLLAVLLPATLAVRRNIVVTLKGGE